MEPAPPPPPPPPVDDHCYRHPNVVTGVHCTRCGRPICTECMVPAPVGHQCPECARGGRQEFHRPARRVGAQPGRGFTLTNALLLVLAAVYGLEVVVAGAGSLVSGPGPLTLVKLGANLGLGQVSPSSPVIGIATGEYWRMFTAMFLHVGIFHLLMNSYALYIFGNVIEGEQGRGRFLLAFVITGLAASATSYAFGDPFVPGAGASGAIFGLFGVFLGHAWRRRDLAFYAQRVRSAMTLIVLNAIIGFTVPNIDWRAHAGGLVAGIAVGYLGEGFGSTSKKAAFTTAIILVVVATVALTIWRTSDLVSTYGPF
jgi:membrane associated rhomboid family serine protease